MDEPTPTQGTGPDRDARRRTFRLVLEYDGRDFEGWQAQAGARPARTVQGVLAEAFASIGCPAARIQAAGRTDTGVHAEGQIASVELDRALAGPALGRALNARLPPDVAVRSVAEVAPGWHATDAARAKLYRYRIWNGAVRSPLRAGRFAWIPERLAVDRMRECGRGLRRDPRLQRAAGGRVLGQDECADDPGDRDRGQGGRRDQRSMCSERASSATWCAISPGP